MRLIELEPQFIRYRTSREERDFIVGDHATWRARGCPSEKRVVDVEYRVDCWDFRAAEGIQFLCPKCFVANKGSVGTHWCEVTFAGRGALPRHGSHNKAGQPTRWTVSGAGYNDLTLTPSILLEGGCGWHGHVTRGEVT